MLKQIFGGIFALTCLLSCSSEYVAPRAEDINSIEDMKAYLRYDPRRDILISGHRGGMMPGYPENCLESFEKTLSLMPVMFEIDFSLTKDSVMVLMHDMTIDRTTNGSGYVADYTYEELQQFNLVDRDGNITDYKIPTLNSLLKWGQNKVIFNFDNKYINTKGMSDEAKLASLEYYARQLSEGGDWASYHNIILAVRSVEEAMFYWDRGIRNVMFMAQISSREAFEKYDACPIPWDYMMAYIRSTVNPELCDVYKKLHENGVMIMTSVAPTSDKISKAKERRTAYIRDLLSEPDILETDYPSAFLELPRTRKEIHAMQDAMISLNR